MLPNLTWHGYLPLTKTQWCWAHMAKLHINLLSKWLKAPAKNLYFGTNDVLVLLRSCHSCRRRQVPAGYPVGQSCDNDHGMIDLDVRTLTGEEFRLRVERSTRGAEVRKMILDNLPVRSGAKLVLDHVRHQTSEQGVEETVRLKLHQTLQEQGFAEAETAILCCTYVPTQLQAAWRFLMGLETAEAELSLEGVTHLTTPSPLCLLHLPQSLISLTFASIFQRELGTGELPLQSPEFDFWWKI